MGSPVAGSPWGERAEGAASGAEAPSRPQRTLVVVAGLVITVASLAMWEFAGRGTSGLTGIAVADYRAQAVPEEGVAPTFELPTVTGSGSVSLTAHKGKVVVLNFWASWCTPCWTEAPGLQRVWRRYRSRGVQFLGVDERDDLYAGRSFIDANGLTFPSGSDPDGRLAFDYRLVAMPTTFVIDRGGLLAFRFVGLVNEQALRLTLDELLGEDP